MKKGNGEQGTGNRDRYSDSDIASGLHSNSPNYDPSPRSLVPSPFLPPSPQSIEETGLRFLELLGRFQPPEFHISRARRFFGFFCDNLKWGTHVKNLLNREETLSGIEHTWRSFFESNH